MKYLLIGLLFLTASMFHLKNYIKQEEERTRALMLNEVNFIMEKNIQASAEKAIYKAFKVVTKTPEEY